jgi:hypothetical protein
MGSHSWFRIRGLRDMAGGSRHAGRCRAAVETLAAAEAALDEMGAGRR